MSCAAYAVLRRLADRTGDERLFAIATFRDTDAVETIWGDLHMNPADKFELHIPSVHGSEKLAMDFAADVARRMNFPMDRVEDLKTAVAEACMNAIEHGNKLDAATRVGIRLTVAADALHVAVQDKGRGVGRVSSPDIDSRLAGKTEPRGWGIFLIENLMDEVTFESTEEGGVVKMIIYFDRPE